MNEPYGNLFEVERSGPKNRASSPQNYPGRPQFIDYEFIDYGTVALQPRLSDLRKANQPNSRALSDRRFPS